MKKFSLLLFVVLGLILAACGSAQIPMLLKPPAAAEQSPATDATAIRCSGYDPLG
jgi:hypothetical protein